MANYILKKKYPSIFLDWEEGMVVGQGNRNGLYANFSPLNSKYSDVQIQYQDIVNYPEFWEKIVEKDYEILEVHGYSGTYKVIDNVCNYFDENESYFSHEGKNPPEHYLKSEYPHHIHSVKRLSDGEIFTVGDKCKPKTTDNVGLITNIEFCMSNSLRIESKGLYYMDINGIKHCKTPLFTTEDKFEIFNEGIPVIIYSRLTKNKLYSGIYLKSLHDEFGYSNVVFFVDPKNANTWIEENKPKYSKKDIEEFLEYSIGNIKFDKYPDFNYWINHVRK